MSVYIDSPRGKEHLTQAFSNFTSVTEQIDATTTLIIPTVDETLPFFAQNRAWFNSKGIEVMVASPNAIYHCRDKAEFNLFCKRHLFQTPRTWQMHGFIKPRFGKGSKGIQKVDTAYVIQEECPFPEVSVDYFADMAGNPISMIARYRLNVVNGESHEMEIVPNFNFASVKRLGKELGLVGHNVIQGYWTGENFIFGEVNPRFGGGSWLTFDIFSSPKWLAERYTCTSTKKSFITPHVS